MTVRVLLALFLVGVGTASAQTVNNPTAVAFQASPDHSTIWTPAPGDPGTAGPVLTNYLLEIQEAGVAVRTTDLGKPTPSSTGDIVTPLTMAGLQQQHTYLVVVIAVGPGGTTRSAAAGPFGWFVSVPIPAPAGVGTVRVLADAVVPAPKTIIVGAHVIAGVSGVLVRVAPSLSAAYDPIVQGAGSLGTVMDGPVVADGYTWWQVTFASGPSGWCTEGPTFLTVAP